MQDADAFRSVHTASLPALLHDLGASVLVSTYQAGRVVVLRGDGELLGTHFKPFPKPMGMAVQGARLVIGTEVEVRELHDVPAAGEGRVDACFMPMRSWVTGNVQIHEVGIGATIWFVNTRFSCLATVSSEGSFMPRWMPRFVSALAPEDRCHLNGLAMAGGAPYYVTALAETDTAHGWRPLKRHGGVIIDVRSGETVARGLCMPHAPRWHDGKLWVLQSGLGALGVVDTRSGAYDEVARFPGFTRGLDFIGPYAFVGLSQVRESVHFGELPITELPLEQRACGVWVVDTRSGETVGWVRFEGAVQEVFSVLALPGRCFPEMGHDAPELVARTFVMPQGSDLR